MHVQFGARITRDYNPYLQSNWPAEYVLNNPAIQFLAKNTDDQVELTLKRPLNAANDDKEKDVVVELRTPSTAVVKKLPLEEMGANIMQTIGMFATALTKAHNGEFEEGKDPWTAEGGVEDNPAIKLLAQADDQVKLTVKKSRKAPDHVDFEIQSPTVSAVKTTSLQTLESENLKTVGLLASALAKAHKGELKNGQFH